MAACKISYLSNLFIGDGLDLFIGDGLDGEPFSSHSLIYLYKEECLGYF